MDTVSNVLSFDPDSEELSRALTRHLVAVTKTARVCMVLGALLIVLGVFSLLVVDTRVNDVIAGFGLAFGALILWANSPVARRRQLRRMVRGTPALTAHREVVATPEGFRVITPTSDSRLTWSQYQSVAVDELGVTLVQRGGTAAQLVPRRAFADHGDLTAWAERVSAWVAEASAPRAV